MNVCILPLRITWGDKPANLKAVEDSLAAIHPHTELVILPEMFSTGFLTGDKEQIRELAERNSGQTVDFLRQMAQRYNVAIAGSFIADTGGLLFNRAFFIEPGGDETFADKRHLFTMAGEHNTFSRGHDRLLVRYRGWNIAMIVCYDIRFPVWCRNVGNEYDLLIAVANWPKVRVDAWNKLLFARAIENEAYVCGVNCMGTDLAGFEYDGSSAIIDFKGKVISSSPAPLTDGQHALYASLSLDSLNRFREKFPAYRDADPFSILGS